MKRIFAKSVVECECEVPNHHVLRFQCPNNPETTESVGVGAENTSPQIIPISQNTPPRDTRVSNTYTHRYIQPLNVRMSSIRTETKRVKRHLKLCDALCVCLLFVVKTRAQIAIRK